VSPWTAAGEPIEIALQVMAMGVGQSKFEILAQCGLHLVAEHSFDYSVKRMTVIYQGSESDDTFLCFAKGATEVILPLLEYLDASKLRSINFQADTIASQGLRVHNDTCDPPFRARGTAYSVFNGATVYYGPRS
jgi:Na+-exporting ATPase